MRRAKLRQNDMDAHEHMNIQKDQRESTSYKYTQTKLNLSAPLESE